MLRRVGCTNGSESANLAPGTAKIINKFANTYSSGIDFIPNGGDFNEFNR